MATLRWVDWFNNHRLFGPIGRIPPAEAEANFTMQPERPSIWSHDSNETASRKPGTVQTGLGPFTLKIVISDTLSVQERK
jgi:hypothetical protein